MIMPIIVYIAYIHKVCSSNIDDRKLYINAEGKTPSINRVNSKHSFARMTQFSGDGFLEKQTYTSHRFPIISFFHMFC